MERVLIRLSQLLVVLRFFFPIVILEGENEVIWIILLRLCSCGFALVPGFDFDDVGVGLLLALLRLFGLVIEIILSGDGVLFHNNYNNKDSPSIIPYLSIFPRSFQY